MKITRYTNRNIARTNFKAGNTKLYTDFDGTYFPFSQDLLKCKDKYTINKINSMYNGFDSFKKTAKDQFSLCVTTGRSKLEMQEVAGEIHMANIPFYSDEYIFRDGLDEQNSIKINEITNDKLDNCMVSQLKGIEKEIKKIDSKISIIYPSNQRNIDDNKDQSLDKLFKELPPERRKNYVSIVAENNGFIQLVFPSNVEIKKYAEQIRKYYKNCGVCINSYNNDKSIYAPVVDSGSDDSYIYLPANTISIKPLHDGKIPDKLIQPKKAAKTIMEYGSDDLVIVAGNAINDKNMLNPLNYLDIFGINIDATKSIKENLEDKQILEAIKKLPVVFIIVGEDRDLDEIVEIKKILDSKRIFKIFISKNPSNDFLNKVRDSMLSYSDDNKMYKYNLGLELYKELLK